MTAAVTEPTQLLAELTIESELLSPAIFDRLVIDGGFDPGDDGPPIPEFEPWTIRGALEVITGQEMTAWTASDAAALVEFLNIESVEPYDDGSPLIAPADNLSADTRAELDLQGIASWIYECEGDPEAVIYADVREAVGDQLAAAVWLAATTMLMAHADAITPKTTVDDLVILIADWDREPFNGDYFTHLRALFGPEVAADMWKQACEIVDDWEDMSDVDDMMLADGGDIETPTEPGL